MSWGTPPATADIDTLVDWMKDYTSKNNITGVVGVPVRDPYGKSIMHDSQASLVKFTRDTGEWVEIHNSDVLEYGYWFNTYIEAFIVPSNDPLIRHSRKFWTRDEFDVILGKIFQKT